jgi:hypothetical protein
MMRHREGVATSDYHKPPGQTALSTPSTYPKPLGASNERQATTSSQSLRAYEAKIRRAQATFAELTDRMSDSEKATVVAGLSAAPLPSRWYLNAPTRCPACKSPALVNGRDKDGDIWFLPRFFGCRVCKLTLTGQELELAGLTAHSTRTEKEVDDAWEPDIDLM